MSILHCPSCKARLRIHIKQGPHIDPYTHKMVTTRRYYCPDEGLWVTTDIPVADSDNPEATSVSSVA